MDQGKVVLPYFDCSWHAHFDCLVTVRYGALGIAFKNSKKIAGDLGPDSLRFFVTFWPEKGMFFRFPMCFLFILMLSIQPPNAQSAMAARETAHVQV